MCFYVDLNIFYGAVATTEVSDVHYYVWLILETAGVFECDVFFILSLLYYMVTLLLCSSALSKAVT